MTTGTFTFRINEKLKKDATQLFESLGLSLSSAINIFLKQSVLKKKFPCSIDLEIMKDYENTYPKDFFSLFGSGKYYLDTNIIIYAIKGTYPNMVEDFKKISRESIVIPEIVLAEIEYGARKSNNYNKTIKKYNEFTQYFDTAFFNKGTSNTYGIIRSELEKKDTPIGPNDLIITSIVLANDGILITHNTKEFERVKEK